MSIAAKTQWMIERNLDEPLTLSDIAEACGVSKHHLAHAFSARFGISVMHYLRARRLGRAAEALFAGKADILDLALASGYSSHEAFSRAFKVMFGVTPEQARRGNTLEAFAMVVPSRFPVIGATVLAEPRFETLGAMLLAGLSQPHRLDEAQVIAAHWQRFMACFDEIPNRKNVVPLGVTTDMNEDGSFHYVCAVEIARSGKLPKPLIELRVPAQTYVVFTHRDHVSAIGATYSAIWNEWFPAHDETPSEGPSLEKHLATFDPRTGMGGVEIFIPIIAKP